MTNNPNHWKLRINDLFWYEYDLYSGQFRAKMYEKYAYVHLVTWDDHKLFLNFTDPSFNICPESKCYSVSSDLGEIGI